MATTEGVGRDSGSRTRKGVRMRLIRVFSFDRIAGLMLLAALAGVYQYDPGPVETLRLKLFDFYQTLKPREITVRPVTIVDIDEESIAEYGQWPWARTLLAELLDRITEAGAGLVAFDIVFPEPDRMNPSIFAATLGLDSETRRLLARVPSNDERFAARIAANRVVLARADHTEEREADLPVPVKSTVVAKRTRGAPEPEDVVVQLPEVIHNVDVLESAAKGHGFVSLFPERDGIVRRVPAIYANGGRLHPSLSVEMLRVGTGRRAVIAEINEAGVDQVKVTKQISLPTDGNGRMWPYFSLPDPEKYVPVKDVLEGRADPSMFNGKLVIVGTSAFGLHDIRAVPVARAMPGVEVHAQIIESALTGMFLERPNYMAAVELTLLVIGGLLLIWLIPVIGAKWSALLFVVFAGAAAASSWYLFAEERILFSVGYLIIALMLVYTFLTFVGYAKEEASRRRVRTAFAHYLAPAMVEKLAEDPGQLKLGGETRTMTMLFCDVRGFTSISETFKGNPEGLTHLINTLLTPLTRLILDRRGTVDKYMGDCIMAFWNAPLDDPEHARNACVAAMEMQREMGPLNEGLRAEAEAEGRAFVPLAIGVGVNTGDVVVGNMGSDQRFDYSVLGDDVNLASRLEGQSKGYNVGIVVGENSRRLASDLAFLELDLIKVKGKDEAVRIFTVVGDDGVRSGNVFPMLAAAHDRMLDAYRNQRWTEAREHLRTCRGLVDGLEVAGLYDVYEGRIAEYEETPPPADWDGVYVATTK